MNRILSIATVACMLLAHCEKRAEAHRDEEPYQRVFYNSQLQFPARYHDACVSALGNPVAFHDGKAQKDTRLGDLSYRVSLTIASVIRGDLDGDGKDEAVVLTVCNGGGSAIETGALVYSMAKDSPRLIGVLPSGDRASSGISEIKIEGSSIHVLRYGLSSAERSLCCPDFCVLQKVELKGRTLSRAVEIKRYPVTSDGQCSKG